MKKSREHVDAETIAERKLSGLCIDCGEERGIAVNKSQLCGGCRRTHLLAKIFLGVTLSRKPTTVDEKQWTQ